MKTLTKLLILLALLSPAFVKASIEITEVMYDAPGADTDREWVEVYNSGSGSVDLSKWYFFSDNTKHSLVPESSATLSGGGYAVIVQNISAFKADWPSFTGIIFDSSWTSFNNEEGEVLAMKDPDQNTVGQVSFSPYSGAKGDGNSLQIIGGSFVSSNPTPGEVNSYDNSNNSDNDTNTEDQEQDTNTNTKQNTVNKSEQVKPAPPKTMKTRIIATANVTAKVPFEIDSVTTGYNGEELVDGKYVWSFGDGMSAVYQNNKPFEYFYEYPGQYSLTLTYYYSILSTEPSAVDHLTINVMNASVSINQVGYAGDEFVEIKNTSSSNIILSGWSIKSVTGKTFEMPEGMTILPNKTIRFSPKVTGFNVNDILKLSLSSPNGEVVSTYPVLKQDLPKINNPKTKLEGYTQKISQKENVVDLDSLSAQTASAKVSNSYLAVFGLILLILLGIVSVFVVKRNSPPSIIDEELSSSDIRIIE